MSNIILEKDIQRQITDYFDKVIRHRIGTDNMEWYHTYNSKRSNKGFPDLNMVINVDLPRAFYLEIKRPFKGRLTPEQRKWIELISGKSQMKYYGQQVYACVVTSLEEAIEKTCNFGVDLL